MAKMIELLSPDEVASMTPELSANLVELAIKRSKTEPTLKEESFFVIPKGWAPERIEILEPLIKWMLSQMVNEGHPSKELPQPYSHVWKGRLFQLYKRLDLEGYISDEQRRRAVSQITKAMRKHKLAVNAGPKSTTWFVRPWPAELRFGSKKQISKAVILEAERQQARHPEQPPTTIHSLSAVRPMPPNAKPEDVVAYVERLVKSYNHLEAAYQTLQVENMDLKADLDQAMAAIDELETDDWQQAALRIQSLVKGEADEQARA